MDHTPYSSKPRFEPSLFYRAVTSRKFWASILVAANIYSVIVSYDAVGQHDRILRGQPSCIAKDYNLVHRTLLKEPARLLADHAHNSSQH